MAPVKRAALLVFAFVIPPAAAGGITVAARLHGQGASLDAAPLGDVEVPGPRPPTSGLPLAVVVVGNHGTEITDSLPVVELLAASGAFEVRVVAPERRPAPFATNTAGAAGVDFLPDLGFDDYAMLVHRPPDLLVVPYLHRWATNDAAVIPWIRAHVGPGTMLLSICQGAQLVAASGLFDGFAATANDRLLDTLAARHPAVRWQRDHRWVRDGRRMSSSLLAGGLDATLAAIDALAGRAATMRAVAATGYPGLRALDDRAQPRSTIPAGIVLEGAYRWERARVGVAIADGVAESAVAGFIDAYATTYTTDTVALASRRGVVRTRHGLALVPRGTIAGFDRGSRVVVAGAGGPGDYGYDVALREVDDPRRERGPDRRPASQLPHGAPRSSRWATTGRDGRVPTMSDCSTWPGPDRRAVAAPDADDAWRLSLRRRNPGSGSQIGAAQERGDRFVPALGLLEVGRMSCSWNFHHARAQDVGGSLSDDRGRKPCVTATHHEQGRDSHPRQRAIVEVSCRQLAAQCCGVGGAEAR